MPKAHWPYPWEDEEINNWGRNGHPFRKESRMKTIIALVIGFGIGWAVGNGMASQAFYAGKDKVQALMQTEGGQPVSESAAPESTTP